MSVERICKNCKLFNPETNRCAVVILHGGEKYNLPVDERDTCFFEDQFTAITPKFDRSGNLKSIDEETFTPEIQEVKWWVEDPNTGETTDGDGVVKIEYPQGFFGKEENE
tara:strand:+ start:2287 stop:2616 length:330 start_codon:yes stop_codon:yes gene_type:complete